MKKTCFCLHITLTNHAWISAFWGNLGNCMMLLQQGTYLERMCIQSSSNTVGTAFSVAFSWWGMFLKFLVLCGRGAEPLVFILQNLQNLQFLSMLIEWIQICPKLSLSLDCVLLAFLKHALLYHKISPPSLLSPAPWDRELLWMLGSSGIQQKGSWQYPGHTT